MSLINKLEIYRLQKNLTQEELAKTLDVSFVTINRWLKGRVKPSQLKEYQIKKLLNQNLSPKDKR
jgi:transcriptional regulator with XRE-family HTH domain